MSHPFKSPAATSARRALVLAAALAMPSAAFAVDGSWVAGDGSFGTPSNWSGNAVPTGGGAASFTQPFAGLRQIGLNVNVSLSQLTFNSTGGYVIGPAGGVITLVEQPTSTGTATLSVTGGHAITAPLAGGTSQTPIRIVKSGPGLLLLSGNNAATSAGPLYAGFDIQAGAIRVDNAAALGAAQNVAAASGGALELAGNIAVANQFLGLATPLANAPNGAVRSVSGNNSWGGTWFLPTAPAVTTAVGVDAGSTLTLNGPIIDAAQPGQVSLAKVGPGQFTVTQPLNLTGLAVNGGTLKTATASASRLGSLAIAGGTAPTARYDVANGGVAITTADLNTVRQQLRASYAPGGGASAWSGNGITTSNGTSNTFGLAYGPASDFKTTFPTSFRGQTVAATDVVVGYARFGDTDLSGFVNIADFSRLRSNYFQSNRRWAQGDFDYNGFVNIADFSLLRSNYFASGPSFTTPAAGSASAGTFAARSESAVGLPGSEPVVKLVVNVSTGETRLVSADGTAGSIVGYEISSGDGSLLPQQWVGADGGGGWSELGSSDAVIAAGTLGTDGMAVGGTGLVLGSIFNSAGSQDLTLLYLNGGSAVLQGTVQYVPEPAGAATLLAAAALLVRRRRGLRGNRAG